MSSLETSLDLLAWRDGIANGTSMPSASDIAEWAERLAAAGAVAAGTLLADVAALCGGFSPQARAGRCAGESGPAPFGRGDAPGGGSTLDRAATELRDLAVLAGLGLRAGPGPRAGDGHRFSTAGGAPIDDVADAARRLRHLLEQPWHEEDGPQIIAMLGTLAEAGRRLSAFDHRAFAGAPLTVLVPAIATAALVDFALSTRDLWEAPRGSPALLHRVAGLDASGLGPYLNNVGRLARDSRDVIELAGLARDEAVRAGGDEGGGAGIEPWIALLSRGCKDGLLRQLVDDLGDADAGEALGLILDRLVSRPAAAVDKDMVRRVRDAGLDNADHALAVRAQRAIVRLHPDDRGEAVVLGSMEASAGAFASAIALFRHWLARRVDDQDLRDRLAAAESGRFDRFAIRCGFGSLPDRREARLRRRGVLPDYPRRQGERIRAVDVG